MEIKDERKFMPTKPYWSRKVGKAGGTRTLAVGKILPPDWAVVKITIEKREASVCILRIERLV